MRFMSASKKSSGFTLVEIMVIAPVVILVISGFVALIIVLTGDVLLTSQNNKFAYSVKSASDMFEQDVRLTTQFLSSSSIPPSPQGVNNDTTAFTTSSSLKLKVLATDKNPKDPTRGLVYIANAPYACNDPNVKNNTPYTINVIYFYTTTAGVNTLWRRVLVDQNYPTTTLCSTMWQQPSCSPGVMSSGSVPAICKTEDSIVLENMTAFSVGFYTDAIFTGVASSPETANTLYLTIAAAKTVAGKQASYSSTLAASKINAP
jgi:hypothetical protein